MNQEVRKALFSLLRLAINETESCNDAEKLITPDTLTPLFNLSKKHDLAHIIGLALLRLNAKFDNEIIKKFQKEQMIAVFRYERLKFDYELLRGALEDLGVDFIPLKGAIIRDLYPEPWMRTSCDIDVLVKKDDAERTIAHLVANGFKKGKDCTEHDHALSSASGTTIELHYTLRQDKTLPKSDEILDCVWDNLKDNTTTFEKQMTDEFFVFYHLVHMAKHFINGGCGIRPFVDLFLIDKNVNYDKQVLNQLLKKAQLDNFYSAVIELQKVWFEGATHTKFTTAMEDFVLFGGVYGNIGNSAKIQAVQGKTKSKTFFSLMFLPRSNLEIIYPKLKKHPVLLPFYQVKRWFRVFKKDSRKRVNDLVKARESVSTEDVNCTEQLIDVLGLK